MNAVLKQIRQVAGLTHDQVLAFVRGALLDAELDVPVYGSVRANPDGAHVLALPYQTVLESSPATQSMPLVPQAPELDRSMIPDPWRAIAKGMNQLILERYPKREAKGPGLGPLDPLPRLSALPKPLADWYVAHGGDWVVQRGQEPAGRLPFVGWRQPFPLAIRYAVMVPDHAGHDRLAVEVLSVAAAAVRLRRSFEAQTPALAVEPELASLVRAMAETGFVPELTAAAEELGSDRRSLVGVTAHHELTDTDLAMIARTLGAPIRPAVVFSVRLVLGAGPELSPGALPHLGSVTTSGGTP